MCILNFFPSQIRLILLVAPFLKHIGMHKFSVLPNKQGVDFKELSVIFKVLQYYNCLLVLGVSFRVLG